MKMDDRFAYILNNLWSRHYDLGRIIRFRHVTRGRQAEAYEVLTAEQNEFLVYLYPPTFDAAQFAHLGPCLQLLGQERFPVVPMIPARTHQWAVDGPQNAHLVVTLNTSGHYLLPDQWLLHHISQLGLRLAWLHRLLIEQIPPRQEPTLLSQLNMALDQPHSPQFIPALNSALSSLPAPLNSLKERLEDLPPPVGHVHGDIQPAAVLLDNEHQIRTFVDWGLLHAGNPLEDLIDVFVHWCIASDGVVNIDQGRTFIEAYRSLSSLPAQPWPDAIASWSAHRLIDAAQGRRPLPRGFVAFLSNPATLSTPLEYCQAK